MLSFFEISIGLVGFLAVVGIFVALVALLLNPKSFVLSAKELINEWKWVLSGKEKTIADDLYVATYGRSNHELRRKLRENEELLASMKQENERQTEVIKTLESSLQRESNEYRDERKLLLEQHTSIRTLLEHLYQQSTLLDARGSRPTHPNSSLLLDILIGHTDFVSNWTDGIKSQDIGDAAKKWLEERKDNSKYYRCRYAYFHNEDFCDLAKTGWLITTNIDSDDPLDRIGYNTYYLPSERLLSEVAYQAREKERIAQLQEEIKNIPITHITANTAQSPQHGSDGE